MGKIDDTVLLETAFVGVGILIFSILMQVAFIIFGFWDITVIYGNILSGSAAFLNFFLMGITVQLAANKTNGKIENLIRLSMILRTVLLFAVAVAGAILPSFNLVAVFVPLFFPRLTITLRPLWARLGVYRRKGE